MALRHTLLIAPVLLALAACETAQENPNYKYSSTYGQQAPQALAQNSRTQTQLQTAPVRYVTNTPNQASGPVIQASTQTADGASYTRVNHACLNQERQRSLIGAGLGGSIGAIAGKKLVGGTKGTLIGAAAGGVAGYGIGDQTIKCDPVTAQAPTQQAVITPAYSSNTANTAPLQPIYAEPAAGSDYTPSLTENTYSSDTIGTPGFEAMQQSQSLNVTSPEYSQPVAAPYSQQDQIIVPAATPSRPPVWPQSRTEIGGNYIVKAGDTVYSLSRQRCATVSSVQSLNNLDHDYNIQVGQALKLPASECL